MLSEDEIERWMELLRELDILELYRKEFNLMGTACWTKC